MQQEAIRNFINDREGSLTKLAFAKTSGTVTMERENRIGQQLSCASPATIPESIAGHISAPALFSFLEWRTLKRHKYLLSCSVASDNGSLAGPYPLLVAADTVML